MKNKHADQPETNLPAGLAQPALRALAAGGIESLEQLSAFSEAEVRQWHGIGPKALDLLREALAAAGLSFADRQSK